MGKGIKQSFEHRIELKTANFPLQHPFKRASQF